MSAKGRGRDTEEDEFYPTPRNVVLSLLESTLIDLPGGLWIEPCAGTGRIIATVNAFRSDVSWRICEINDGFRPYLQMVHRPGIDIIEDFGDFVFREWPYPKADVLIMNPPFSLTFKFVLAALDRARIVVCLQRQGWFGSVTRAPWLAQHCPDSFQLPWRPSFRPDGKTDNCEYCWFHWPENSHTGRREGRIAMLEKPQSGQQNLFD